MPKICSCRKSFKYSNGFFITTEHKDCEYFYHYNEDYESLGSVSLKSDNNSIIQIDSYINDIVIVKYEFDFYNMDLYYNGVISNDINLNVEFSTKNISSIVNFLKKFRDNLIFI